MANASPSLLILASRLAGLAGGILIANFSAKVGALLEQVKVLQRQVRNLRRTRDLLLPRLLSGQINVEAP